MKIPVLRVLAKLVPMLLLGGCGWYLYRYFQWPAIIALLGKTEVIWLLMGTLGGCTAVTVLRAWRWWLMIRTVNPQVGFGDVYLITGIVVNLAVVTPGQLGETLKIELLKRRITLDRTTGIGSFFIERVIDMVMVASFGMIGWLGQDLSRLGFASRPVGYMLGGIIGVGIVALVLLLRWPGQSKLGVFVRRLLEAGNQPMLWLKIIPISWLTWSCIALGWKLSLLSVAIDLSVPQTLWLMSVTALAQVFSLIPGGLGVSEVVVAKLLQVMGYDAAQAEAGALILRCFSVVMISFGLVHGLVWQRLYGWVSVRRQAV
jgi:uncharacterized membrane protein YbhN (UPF0104 family)